MGVVSVVVVVVVNGAYAEIDDNGYNADEDGEDDETRRENNY